MKEKAGADSGPLSNAGLAKVLSPLLFFFAHLVYLAAWSPEPFLNKWIGGCFSFFLALVLCNIIRARISAAAAPGDPADSGEGEESP